MINFLDNKFIFYTCKDLNPENNDPNFFDDFDNKKFDLIDGTAIEVNNSGFRMIEDK